MRLWELHNEVARPSDIHRLGLRFINLVRFSQDEAKLEDFLENPPKPPRGMDVPFEGFLHRQYAVGAGATLWYQCNPDGAACTGKRCFLGVILDIDVFTTEPIVNLNSIESHLIKMRWLKNKVFFGSVTAHTLELFK